MRSIVQVKIDPAKFRAHFGSETFPALDNVLDGYLLDPPRNGCTYTVVWEPAETTPFMVWAEEFDLKLRGLHRVGYDSGAYMALFGEKPKVRHLVPGHVLRPILDGFFTVVSLQDDYGWLLVEREEATADGGQLCPARGRQIEDDEDSVCGAETTHEDELEERARRADEEIEGVVDAALDAYIANLATR